MTIANDLITRVRDNINEVSSAGAQRSDAQILQWLQDGQIDYISKVPADAVHELITSSSTASQTFNIPSDFVRLISVDVAHTISGTVTTTDPAYILSADEGFLALYYPGGIGAYAQFRDNQIITGPNAFNTGVRYLKTPTTLSTTSTTFTLNVEHEEPVVLYATGLALDKINDVDSALYMKRYEARIAAIVTRFGEDQKMEVAL